MRRRHHQHPVFQPYSDVLLNILGTFIVIIAVLVLTMSVKSKHNLDAHPKAEYLITLTWDDKRNVDLDLWVEDPFHHIVYYNNREASGVSLDRDSRGFDTDTITLPNGKIVTSSHREVVTIRSVIPGDWVVAVGYYVGQDEKDGHTYAYQPTGKPDPEAGIDFNIQVEKVNPTLTPVFGGKFHFDRMKQSMDVAHLHINDDGTVDTMPIPAGDSLIKDHGGNP